MSILRRIVRIPDNLCRTRKCFIGDKNSWNAECCFGTKIEIPSPPKKPLTAYMIFCKENRKNILKENPSLTSPEQIKILAKKWSHLTPDMKKPYEVSAREGIVLYGEAHKTFYENLTEEQKTQMTKLKAEKRESRRLLKLKRALRESGVPKSPISSYGLFIQSEAKSNLDTKRPSEFLKKAAETWKSLPEESKKVFENQAQAHKEHFANELKEWKAKMILDGKENLVKAYEEMKTKGKSSDTDHDSHRKKKVSEAVKESPTESRVSKN